MKKLFDRIVKDSSKYSIETMPILEYVAGLAKHSSYYANAAERMLKAIGDPIFIDTKKDSKLGRIFANQIIKTYPSFKGFYGLERTVESIVSYFKYAAQGLEEKKQILYLLGPVGGGKSSLAEKLKRLMEQEPIYVLAIRDDTNSASKDGVILSPVFESPLGLFKKTDSEELKIPARYLTEQLSPWAIKRLKEFDFDVTKFVVAKVYPSEAFQRAISKTEPGDENTQDVTTLKGTVEIRKLGKFSEHDPDAYGYHGALNIANQGLLEFVEMFKAPIKVLNPLLSATQEGSYDGDKGVGSLPFHGVVLAHSNEAEWTAFRNNKNNEAFIDRVNIVPVPYTLRIHEELKIYEKLINDSYLVDKPRAPQTLEILSKFSVMTRLHVPPNTNVLHKALLYDGENIKDQDPKSKSYEDYKKDAGVDEGMNGLSTRLSYKILSKVYNADAEEIAANPIHLFKIIQTTIMNEHYDDEKLSIYKAYLETLKDEYKEWLEKEIISAYIEGHQEYGQNRFDQYVMQADLWLQDRDYKDENSGELMNQAALNSRLKEIEEAAEVTNTKDFRQEVVNFCFRYRLEHGGDNPPWTSYAKMKKVIEKQMFTKMEELLPVIGYGKKENSELQTRHDSFIDRMLQKGYTKKQVKTVVEWHINNRRG
jgi:serine protein kinase